MSPRPGSQGPTSLAKYNRTPLLYAAAKGHEAAVLVLLEKGANTEAVDATYGSIPLSWAAEKCHEIVVQLLLVSGCNCH
jgi:ankyrin repeat protein